MSNKSGIAEQVITLAKGGGEMKGLGETFSPDMHTGTGNFSVPFSLPAGRNGFQPELGLAYSTGNGNSCFGLGWQLSVPGVSRKTSKGIPRYAGEDAFLLSGAEDLVPVAVEAGRTRYRPRTEGLFALISRYLDENNDYWEVKSRDGLVSYYGTPGARRDDLATVYDPEDATRDKVFSWKLSETRDVFGNRIIYEYERDAQNADNRHWNQTYLKTIRYLDYTDANGEEQFLVSVHFEYEEDRPDAFSVYTSGFEIRTTKLCSGILIQTHPTTEEAVQVRRYDFMYEAAPLSRFALLKEMQVTGIDETADDPYESLPPLQFSYTAFEPAGQDFHPVSGSAFPLHSLASEDTELVGLFGNGLPDIIQMNGTVRYWKNLGNGRFDAPRQMKEAPGGITLADPNVQFMDANGEGRADLVVHNNALSGYFPTQFNGQWDRRSFRKHQLAPSFSLQDPEVKLVDLDGDGVTDALRSGSRMECYFNGPEKGWHDLITVERQALNSFPNVNLSDPRVRLADMSGDSLQDIVLIHDRNVEYWPYMGYGKWGKRIQMRNAPRLPRDYDPRRLLVGDIAGDGPHDIIYVDHGQVRIWINQNGNGFSDEITIEGTPPVTDMDAVRLVDLKGTGINGILWSADQRTPGRDHYYFLDLTGGVKPYVLNEMNNNMGAITKVEYRPSTYYYLQDEKSPETRWKTPLPFPVQVVACVEVIDAVSRNKLVTEYRYRHGYWDGAEREFRGFGRVEQIDTQTFEVYRENGLHGDSVNIQEVQKKHYTPPTKTITWFHQGPVGEGEGEWRVLDYSDEYWQGDPSMLESFSNLDAFLAGLTTRRERRDALRALRGSVLRTELYELEARSLESIFDDGSDDDEDGPINIGSDSGPADAEPPSSRPYTVSESVFAVRKEGTAITSLKGMSGAIFFPFAVAQRSTQWERGHDPMTSFSFTEDYDAYGHARKQVAIACPRGWQVLEDAIPEDTPFLSTYSESVLGYANGESPYLKGLGVKSSSYEICHEGQQTLLDIKNAVAEESRLALFAQSITYYDGEAFIGLPFGQVGDYGVPVRTEAFVIDKAILAEAYKSGQAVADTPEMPPFLLAEPGWPSEYPAAFRDTLPELAGYTFYDGSGEHARGFWAQASRVQFDFQDNGAPSKGLPLVQRDPLGREARIEYDGYHFLPVRSIDPIGLATTAEYDYRLFQAQLSKDPNDNVATVRFSPLGFVVENYLIGKEGGEEGDALGRNDPQAIPSSRFEYDFFAYQNDGQPIYVKSIVREHHKYEADAPAEQMEDTIATVEFSDGFGRTVQTRTQAEDVLFGDPQLGNELLPEDQDAPGANQPQTGRVRQPGEPQNVVVSGWQFYDNKGQVVMQYEPFYSTGFDYADVSDQLIGQKTEQFYDPVGRVVLTLNPDGSQQRVLFGVPGTITDPDLRKLDDFEPTPWEAYTYDANDCASHFPGPRHVLPEHFFTPASIEVDALGRTVRAVARNRHRENGVWSDLIEYETRSTYDIRGNLLTVTDPLGRVAFRYTYDYTFDEEEGSQVWRIESIDAGLRRMVLNVMSLEIERRDRKGALSLQAYDELNRPTHAWARDHDSLPLTLRQRLIYGDTLSPSGGGWGEEKDQNLLGQLHQHYDEAGLVEVPAYDFKGNPLSSSRRTIKDEHLLALVGSSDFQHFQIDWGSDDPETLLEATAFQTDTTYDALNRPKQITYPEDVDGERKVVVPAYNRAGALESISLVIAGGLPPSGGQGAGVRHLAYNARGQRTLVVYHNGLMTRYAYDDRRFWLKRLRTEKYDRPAAEDFQFAPSGGMLQDLAYEYDLVGNITRIADRSRDAGIGGSDRLNRTFEYDPIYRLIAATGREHRSQNPSREPWMQDLYSTNFDVNHTAAYTRHYHYDPAGNMLRLQHITPGGQQDFTRTFVPRPATDPNEFFGQGNNQLEYYRQGTTNYRMEYDRNGNLIQENSSRRYYWNDGDELHSFRQEAGGSVSLEARYLYDAGGQRVKKIVWRQGGKVNTTTYIGGLFEYHTKSESGSLKANNSLHLMDDQSRIALIRVGDALDANDINPAVQYQLGDHLGNVHFVVNAQGQVRSREEHYPFGGTSFGSFAKKRYRFTGKERDEESGLNYHRARYYAHWQCKWVSADPAGMVDGVNLFIYTFNGPIISIDTNGNENVIVVGNQGSSPTSDYDEERFSINTSDTKKIVGPGYRYRLNTRHFLQAGFESAGHLLREATSKDEKTTLLVYRGDYTQGEIDHYKKLSVKAGINYIVVKSISQIEDYINYKSLDASSKGLFYRVLSERQKDLITDFTYVGHAGSDALYAGFHLPAGNTKLFPKSFDKDAFDINSRFFLNGCNTGLDTPRDTDVFEVIRGLTQGEIISAPRKTWWGRNAYGPGLGRFELDRTHSTSQEWHREQGTRK